MFSRVENSLTRSSLAAAYRRVLRLSLVLIVGLTVAGAERKSAFGQNKTAPSKERSKPRAAKPAPGSPLEKLLARPEAFETLVNPNCSHCVDEAKRRASELRDDDRVLAWIRGKYEGGGIPWRFFLAPYRVISDTYGVFVYDADAGYVRGYEPSLEFKFHGWRNGVMVIRHSDGTLFSALSGKAFAGPRVGESLVPVATLETDWGFWSAAYPGSVAYHMFEKYQPIELPQDDHPDSVATRLPLDTRLEANEPILGISLGEHSKAYRLSDAESAGGLISDRIGDQDVAVFWRSKSRSAAAYAPETDDEAGAVAVKLVLDPANERAPYLDQVSGSRFGVEGRALDGPLQGKTLRWLPGVQCRWFAWAAEYPTTEVFAPPVAAKSTEARGTEAPPKGAAPRKALIVAPTDITSPKIAQWRDQGVTSIVVLLDESFDSKEYERAAAAVKKGDLELAYWVEVGRSPALADAHPEWMAALGTHLDWRERFPNVPEPGKDEVAKAYPWVTIGYQEAFDAQLTRVEGLLSHATADYKDLLLADLQNGPASCGCGNLQCRWAVDYGVASTATKLEGDDAAAKFLAAVAKLAPGKRIVPVWMTECEDQDLPAEISPGGKTTGYCGSVHCSRGRCPSAFAEGWRGLLAGHAGPVAIMATHGELGRTGSEGMVGAEWTRQIVEFLTKVPGGPDGEPIARERLWLVTQGYDLPTGEAEAVETSARETGVGTIAVALTKLDQSYEPRIVPASR